MLALVFPGQGAAPSAMLASMRAHGRFGAHAQAVNRRLGIDLPSFATDGSSASGNLASSLLTVVASAMVLEEFRERAAGEPSCVAGYSVGQWSAMYAAGMLDYETLITVVAKRATLMDACVARTPGAMCAVIGLSQQAVETAIAEVRSEGLEVFVGNYNCAGQYSLSGTVAGIEAVERRLRAMRPRKLTRLPVTGAWHSPLLAEAERHFREFLGGLALRPPHTRVIDNVTGEPLSTEGNALRDSLARHISHAVRWDRGVKTMIAAGCNRIVEIGYGNTLTKFGFFIDCRVEFSAQHG